jgi:HEPN domain-containing protein
MQTAETGTDSLLTREKLETRKPGREFNSMLSNATSDYVAARCLLLNWLPAGFVQAEQAMEKFLKAYLMAWGQPNPWGHDLPALLAEATTTLPLLAKFTSLATTLGYAYAERYEPVDRPIGSGYSTALLDTLDEFVVTILEHINLPDEVLCSGQPFYWLFEERLARAGWQVAHWMTVGNKAMTPRLDAWRARFNQIHDHYTPNRVK